MGRKRQTDYHIKKLTGGGGSEELSLISMWQIGRNAGLTVAEMDEMTIGMILDVAYQWINTNAGNRTTDRQATQADYDGFCQENTWQM